MTCSACVSNITSALERHDWTVSELIAVNLAGNSAPIHILGRHEATELVELVDDLGYKANVEEATPLILPHRYPGTPSTDSKVLWNANFSDRRDDMLGLRQRYQNIACSTPLHFKRGCQSVRQQRQCHL